MSTDEPDRAEIEGSDPTPLPGPPLVAPADPTEQMRCSGPGSPNRQPLVAFRRVL